MRLAIEGTDEVIVSNGWLAVAGGAYEEFENWSRVEQRQSFQRRTRNK